LKATGASLVLVGLIVLALRRVLGPVLVDSLIKTDANRPAGRAVFAIETQILRDIAIALVAYGLFAILAAFLAGPSRLAVAIRRVLAPTFQRGPVVVYGIAFTIFLLFIIWGPTGATRRVLGIVLLGALFMLAIEIWRRQILREFPPDYPGRLGWASLRPEPSPSGSGGDSEAGRVDALERLAKLHTSGVLTDAEYGAEKARLLGEDEAPAISAPPQPAGS
jgi:Short C-terminal domain